MTAVSDSSPLISLAAISSLDLLQSLFRIVVIPDAVYQEVAAGKGKPGAREMANADWIVARTVANEAEVGRLMASERLGRGEAETIALAKELRANPVILDDHQARQAARRHRLPVLGTLGLLVAAKRAGLVSEIRTRLQALVAEGAYIHPRLYREILQHVDEA